MIERDRCTDLAYHAHHYADMEPHVATLTRLAKDHRSALELGVRGGVSTWAILDGLPPDGRLLSVDIDATCRDLVPRRVQADPRWTFVADDDRNAWIAGRLPPASFVFIDTSHTYHHTAGELAIADKLGARVIVLHDYNEDGVGQPVDEFVAEHHGWRVTIEPSDWGLAILTRR